MNTSRLANASGNWNNSSNAGAFHLNVNQSTSNTNTNIGAHFNIQKSSPKVLDSIMCYKDLKCLNSENVKYIAI